MEDGVKLHGLPLWQQIKDLLVVNENGQLILAIIRGDYDVNEMKLARVTKSIFLRHATDEEIRKLGSEAGFISPVGLKGKVLIVGDSSLRTIRNAYGGANKKYLDALNMNIDRDYTCDLETDIAMVKNRYLTEDGKSKLIEKHGIEVGNIFQLGYHYTRLMKGANFIDEDGKEKPYYMGCYGIGIGRTLAAVVEIHHDDKGIIWPENIAPFQVHLISLPGGEKLAAEVYQKLINSGVEVLWDEREVSAGVKFADADLLGIPWRAVVSAKTAGKIELKRRTENKTKLVELDDLSFS